MVLWINSWGEGGLVLMSVTLLGLSMASYKMIVRYPGERKPGSGYGPLVLVELISRGRESHSHSGCDPTF